MAELKSCPYCGNYDISVFEEKFLFFSKKAFIKCNICGGKIERRTIKRATKEWNTRTPKERGGEK